MTERFTNSDIKKLIVPLFFEQLLAMLVGLVDTFMISSAGDAAVSGVSLVNQFSGIFIYLFSALAAGGAVVVSQYIGSGNRENGDRSAGQLLMVSTLIGLFFMAVSLIWRDQLLRLLFGRVEADVMEACQIYLQISAYSFPAIAIYNAGAALCRSMGKTKITMYVSILSNLINVAGNAIGVYVLHAGVAGVAWPTLIARVFSAVVITALCFRPSGTVSYRLPHILTWKNDMIARILKIAVPNAVENGLFQFIKVALSSIVALFGTAQIAANGVAQSFWSMAALAGVAMSPVFVTVIGQCMGARDIDGADYYFKKLTKITYTISIVWNILVFAATPIALHFYSISAEAKQLTLILVLIHNVFNAVLFPISGGMSSGLRAAGDVKYSMYVSLFATVCGRLVLSVVLGLWLDLGVIGIALAMCCDWGIRAFLFARRYRSGKWKEFRVI